MSPAGPAIERRIAVVTGGEGGLGRAIGAHLAQAGLTVVSLDLAADRRANTTNTFLQCDVTDERNVADVIQVVRKRSAPRSVTERR